MNNSERPSMPCKACRGRGWKLRRSRRALISGTLERGSAQADRRMCADCGGSKQAG